MLNERNQSVDTTYCMVPITWHSGKGKTTKFKKKKNPMIPRVSKGGIHSGAFGIFRAYHSVWYHNGGDMTSICENQNL